MNRYALVINGVVDLVVEQDTAPTLAGLWVDVTGLHVGPKYSYDGENFTPPVLDVELNIITKAAFRFRLTDAEYIGILSAAKIDVEVQAWVETFNMVTQVNLDDPRTATGLEMMVTKGLLTEERKTEILTDQVKLTERP
jgi:hypothetical protein